jgi:hypothetical protein
MNSSAGVPIKANCRFIKPNGEPCKRNVDPPEQMCWQHASTWRHRLKSLTRSQTVAFSGLVLSLILAVVFGAPSLYFSYISWQDSRTKTTHTPDTPTAPKPRPTMREFFKQDFTSLPKITETVPFVAKAGWSQEIDAQLYVDLAGKAVFVGYFIPSSSHTVDICRELANEPRLTITDLEKKLSVKGGYVGENSKTKLTDLTFTGRVYIYHETNLTPKDVDRLTDLYTSKSLSLILRGFDYFLAAQQSKNISPTIQTSSQENLTPKPTNGRAPPNMQSDVAMHFINAKSPSLVLVNRSEAMARNIKWAVEVWNMDLPDRNDPLPIPVQTFDFIRGHNEAGPQSIFQDSINAGLVKPGNRLFGSATVDCPDCIRGHSYIVYIAWGRSGWVSEVLNEKLGRILAPPNFSASERSKYFDNLEATARPESRMPIQ